MEGVTFSWILWNLSATAPLVVFGTVWKIPGYLLWASLFVGIASTLINNWIGKKLARLNYLQQRYEADYRFGLIHIRQAPQLTTESITELEKSHGLMSHFSNIITNFILTAKVSRKLTAFSQGYYWFSMLLCVLLPLPAFFAKKITLGVLMQISSAIGVVLAESSIIITIFPQLADWRAVVDRLVEMRKKLFLSMRDG
jgi:putative ATP-binding cassette transporter